MSGFVIGFAAGFVTALFFDDIEIFIRRVIKRVKKPAQKVNKNEGDQ